MRDSASLAIKGWASGQPQRDCVRFGTILVYRFVEVAVFLVRFAVFVLGLVAVVIATVPILVLIDLVGGGTGYGLCPSGLGACDKPYSTAAEFAVLLTVGLGLVVLGIRILMRLARRLRDDSYQVSR
jgi:hypothetical protein